MWYGASPSGSGAPLLCSSHPQDLQHRRVILACLSAWGLHRVMEACLLEMRDFCANAICSFPSGTGHPTPTPPHRAKKSYLTAPSEGRCETGHRKTSVVVFLTCWVVRKSGVPGGGRGTVVVHQPGEECFSTVTTGTDTRHTSARCQPRTHFPHPDRDQLSPLLHLRALRKLSPREVKLLAQDHQLGRGRAGIHTQGVCVYV